MAAAVALAGVVIVAIMFNGQQREQPVIVGGKSNNEIYPPEYVSHGEQQEAVFPDKAVDGAVFCRR
jgi:hypothetical protein